MRWQEGAGKKENERRNKKKKEKRTKETGKREGE